MRLASSFSAATYTLALVALTSARSWAECGVGGTVTDEDARSECHDALLRATARGPTGTARDVLRAHRKSLTNADGWTFLSEASVTSYSGRFPQVGGRDASTDLTYRAKDGSTYLVSLERSEMSGRMDTLAAIEWTKRVGPLLTISAVLGASPTAAFSPALQSGLSAQAMLAYDQASAVFVSFSPNVTYKHFAHGDLIQTSPSFTVGQASRFAPNVTAAYTVSHKAASTATSSGQLDQPTKISGFLVTTGVSPASGVELLVSYAPSTRTEFSGEATRERSLTSTVTFALPHNARLTLKSQIARNSSSTLGTLNRANTLGAAVSLQF